MFEVKGQLKSNTSTSMKEHDRYPFIYLLLILVNDSRTIARYEAFQFYLVQMTLSERGILGYIS